MRSRLPFGSSFLGSVALLALAAGMSACDTGPDTDSGQMLFTGNLTMASGQSLGAFANGGAELEYNYFRVLDHEDVTAEDEAYVLLRQGGNESRFNLPNSQVSTILAGDGTFISAQVTGQANPVRITTSDTLVDVRVGSHIESCHCQRDSDGNEFCDSRTVTDLTKIFDRAATFEIGSAASSETSFETIATFQGTGSFETESSTPGSCF